MWETVKAIHSMTAHRVPGQDGFQLLFFHKYWDIVGPSIHQLVSSPFLTGEFDLKLNETLLVLIPKEENQETIKQFRHISLCNVIYKVITKVLVNRLKPCRIHWLVLFKRVSCLAGRRLIILL